MRIAIAIQNYNGERWLAECLAAALSVARCSYDHEFKIYLLDAGSTDSSLEIAAHFPEIELIKHPKLNQSSAMNLVINRMDYDWFGFVNCDDHLMPQYFREHFKTIVKYPDADILHSLCVFWIERNKSLHLPDTNTWEEGFRNMGHNRVSQPTILINRDAFKRYGVFDESINYVYDYEFVTRVWKNGGKIVVTPEITAYYRARIDNMSSTINEVLYPEWQKVARMNCGVLDPK